MRETENLHLRLPEYNDYAEIEDLNGNFTKLEDVAGALDNRLGEIDVALNEKAAALQTSMDTHINDQAAGVHGATVAPTPEKIAIRDSFGRLQVAVPADAADAINKQYMDAAKKEHNEDDEAHPAIQVRLTDLDSRIKTLELKYATDVTGNPFSVDFQALDGLIVTGVWNEAYARIEF